MSGWSLNISSNNRDEVNYVFSPNILSRREPWALGPLTFPFPCSSSNLKQIYFQSPCLTCLSLLKIPSRGCCPLLIFGHWCSTELPFLPWASQKGSLETQPRIVVWGWRVVVMWLAQCPCLTDVFKPCPDHPAQEECVLWAFGYGAFPSLASVFIMSGKWFIS